MKRKSLLLSLVGLLLLSTGLLLFLNKQEPLLEEANDFTPSFEETVYVLDIIKDDVAEIEIIDINGEVSFIPSETGWELKDPSATSLNDSSLSSSVNSLLAVISYTQIEDMDPAEFGLDEGHTMVNYTFKDGSTTSLILGNNSLDGSKVYAYSSDSPTTAHLISSYVARNISSDLNRFRTDSFAQIPFDSIVALNASGRDFDTIHIEYDVESSSYSPFVITQPFENTLEVNTDRLSNLFESIPQPSIQDFVEDYVTDLSIYGLDDPALKLTVDLVITQDLSEVETVTYLWGDYADENSIYFMEDGGDSVYTMPSASVNAFMELLDPFVLTSSLVSLINIDDVNSIDIHIDNTVHTLSITRQMLPPTAEDSTDPEEDTRYYLNDIEMEEDDFKFLYRQVIGITSDVDLTSYDVNLDTSPVMTSTFYLADGTTLTHEFFEYDNQFYAYKLDEHLIVGCNIRQFDFLRDQLAQ